MKTLFCTLLFVFLISGCGTTIPKDALELTPKTLADRQLQTRKYDTVDKNKMLSAASAVLQDLGFTLDESEKPLGLLTATKRRSAVDGGQIAGAVILALLFGVSSRVDQNQTIRVSIVMRETSANDSTVRVTFQRVVYGNYGVHEAEQIVDAEIYKDFFERLSKSVFLEAHEI